MLLWYALIGVFVWGLFDIACGIGILMRLLCIPLGWLMGWNKKPTFGLKNFKPKFPLREKDPEKPTVDEHGIPYL